MKSYKFIISGKVQGVSYRVSIQKNALRSNYKGYVKNLPDKTVEACVSCAESDLPHFIKILKNGSPYSNVIHIEQSQCHTTFTKTFEIR
jgi:acylphosphatase